MRADTKSVNSPRRRFIAVDWQDCAWQPRIEVRPAAPPPDFHSPRRNFISQKIMKTNLPHSRRHRAGFTLVELLVVIAIIGILAGLLLPVLAAVKKHALMTKAHLEAVDIATAIQGYDSAYGRFPVSAAAQAAANPDFTYGGSVLASIGVTGASATSNAEVMAILMDMTSYPNGSPTVNTNHVKNPQQTKFLNAKLSGYDPNTGGQPDPGMDITGVYRDPWGSPYVITMDLNYDEMCKDAFYCTNLVSKASGSTGYKGLFDPTDPTGNDNNFEYRGKVMVWSAGPDKKIDPNAPADGPGAGFNRDNVLSWQ